MSDLPFTVESSEEVYRSRFNRIRIDHVRMPDGDTTDREIVEHLSAVGAVPLTAQGEVVLLRQYRHAFGERFWEIPAGKLDQDGEDPAEAMQRELAEEVQLRAGRLEHLLTFTNSAGWNDERTHVYLATELVDAPRPGDFTLRHEEADMEIRRVPLERAVQMVHDGEIVDAKTVVGLLALASRRQR